MISWIGKKFFEGFIRAERERDVQLYSLLLPAIASSTDGKTYKSILMNLYPSFSKAEIDGLLETLVDAGEIRREGQTFHVAA
jgi:hypothetical protein